MIEEKPRALKQIKSCIQHLALLRIPYPTLLHLSTPSVTAHPPLRSSTPRHDTRRDHTTPSILNVVVIVVSKSTQSTGTSLQHRSRRRRFWNCSTRRLRHQRYGAMPIVLQRIPRALDSRLECSASRVEKKTPWYEYSTVRCLSTLSSFSRFPLRIIRSLPRFHPAIRHTRNSREHIPLTPSIPPSPLLCLSLKMTLIANGMHSSCWEIPALITSIGLTASTS